MILNFSVTPYLVLISSDNSFHIAFWTSPQVGSDDDVQVGDTHDVRIDSITDVTSVPASKIIIVEKVIQIHCESAEEMSAWVTGLSVLRKVCEIEKCTGDADSLSSRTFTSKTSTRLSKIDFYDTTFSTDDATEIDILKYFLNYHVPRLPRSLNLLIQYKPGDVAQSVNKLRTSPLEPTDEALRSAQTNLVQDTGANTANERNEHDKDQIKLIVELKTQLQESELKVEEKNEIISKLGKRLDHSLQMLKAVHEMYEQQQRVLQAQDAVIKEMDGANQAIQSAAGQMKSLLAQSKTPTKSQIRSTTPTRPLNMSAESLGMLWQNLSQASGSVKSAPNTPGIARMLNHQGAKAQIPISSTGVKSKSRADLISELTSANAMMRGSTNTSSLNFSGQNSGVPESDTSKANRLNSAHRSLEAELHKLAGMSKDVEGEMNKLIGAREFVPDSSAASDPNRGKSGTMGTSVTPGRLGSPAAPKTAMSSHAQIEHCSSELRSVTQPSAPHIGMARDLDHAESLMRKIQDMRGLLEGVSNGSVDPTIAAELAANMRSSVNSRSTAPFTSAKGNFSGHDSTSRVDNMFQCSPNAVPDCVVPQPKAMQKEDDQHTHLERQVEREKQPTSVVEEARMTADEMVYDSHYDARVLLVITQHSIARHPLIQGEPGKPRY